MKVSGWLLAPTQIFWTSRAPQLGLYSPTQTFNILSSHSARCLACFDFKDFAHFDNANTLTFILVYFHWSAPPRETRSYPYSHQCKKNSDAEKVANEVGLVRRESVEGVNSLFLPLHFQQFWVLSSGNRDVPTGESSVVREGVCMWAGALQTSSL